MTTKRQATLTLVKQFGLVAGFCICSLLVIGVLVRLSQSSWQNKLRLRVQATLDEASFGEWMVGRFVPIAAPLSLQAACYAIYTGAEPSGHYALIIRIQTIYGPLPAVFRYHRDEGATFVAFSNVHGRIAETVKNNPGDARILYWTRRIPELFVGVEDGR
ncbi:MAG: hypothetical protein IJ191_03215 [Treponema sp.]|nr:hypothetical protein [Treponema sp.]